MASRRALHTYEYVDVPFKEVTRLIAEDPAGVLQAATDSAAGHARDVVARLTVEVGGFEIGHDVEIEVGEFEPVGITHVRVPLRWHGRQLEALFPSMEASLEVRALPVEDARTQIVLTGSYAPPMGALGAAIDEAVGHHVAEAAVHRFVRDIADRVERVATGG